MKKEKFKKVANNIFFKGMAVISALIFTVLQTGDTCLIWKYQPELPKDKENFSIKDL